MDASVIFLSIIFVGLILYACFLSPSSPSFTPDVHPILIFRQSSAAPVRYPGQSAIHRNSLNPVPLPLLDGSSLKSFPLNSTINYLTINSSTVQETSHFITPDSVNFLTANLASLKISRLAVFLPTHHSSTFLYLLLSILSSKSSIEHLILLPECSIDKLSLYLEDSKADSVILPMDLASHVDSDKFTGHLITLPCKTQKPLPQSAVEWHKLISIPPTLPISGNFPSTRFIGLYHNASFGVTSYPVSTLLAAAAAIQSSLPYNHKLSTSDRFLCLLRPNRSTYSIAFIMAALHANATPIISELPTLSCEQSYRYSPTVVLLPPTKARSLLSHYQKLLASSSLLHRLCYLRKQSIIRAGKLPSAFFPTSAKPPLRLIIIPEEANSPSFTRSELSQLRIFTGARVIYATTVPYVAGALCQTHFFDYRTDTPSRTTHFGPPLPCLEIKLIDTPANFNTNTHPVGQISVTGPAVINEHQELPYEACIAQDGTLFYLNTSVQPVNAKISVESKDL